MKHFAKGLFWLVETAALGYTTITTCSDVINSRDIDPPIKFVAAACTFMLGTAFAWSAYAEATGMKINVE